MAEITEIVLTLSPDHLQEVILRALEHRSQVSEKSRKFFERAIEALVSIKGFRTPLNAPASLTTQEIKRILKKPGGTEPLLWAIFRIWMESHSELRQSFGQFCADTNINLGKILESSEEQPSFEEVTSKTVEAFIKVNPEYKVQDANLMCQCLAHDITDETKKEEPELKDQEIADSRASEFWRCRLEEIRQLKADAAEWNEFDNFINAARQIAQEKGEERESLLRLGDLEEALSKLKDDAADTFSFFGFIDIPTWDALTVDPEKAPVLTEEVKKFHEKLLSHKETRGQTPDTLAAEEDRRNALRTLEKEILNLKQRIDADLAPKEAPSEAESSVAEEVVEPSEQEIIAVKPEIAEKEVVVEEAPSVEVEQAMKEEASLEEVIEEAEVEPEEEPEGLEAYFWQLVAQDDLAGAYWLCRSMEAQQAQGPVPSQVMAAVQGVRWLKDYEGGGLADDLVHLIAQIERPGKNDEAVMMGLAAALRGCLILPPNDMFGWLQEPHCLKPGGGELVGAVQDFVQKGCRLFSMNLLEAGKVEERQKAIKEASQKIRQWLEEAPYRRLKIRRASLVWSHMVRKDLAELLDSVKNDNRSQVEEVGRNLKQWQDPIFIGDQIDRIDRKISELKKNPIVGEPRKRMIRDVIEICQEAERWRDLVELDQNVSDGGDWLFNQALTLRSKVQNALPEVEAKLDQLKEPLPLASAASCLQRSLAQIKATLKLSTETKEEGEPWGWLFLQGQSLEAALNRRLLLFPNIPMGNDYVPAEAGITGVAQALREAGMQEDPLISAFEGYLANEDYRFLESDLLPALSDSPDHATLENHYQDARQTSRVSLNSKIQETSTAIEQALIDGIISDQEHSDYDSKVIALDPEKELNFQPQRDKLDEILDNLKKARKDRLDQLKEEWRQVEGRLRPPLIPAEHQEFIRSAVRRSISDHDTRVLEEHLAHLTQVLDGAEVLDLGWFTVPSPRRKGISDFLNAAREIEENLKKGPMQWREMEICLRNGRTWAGLKFGPTPRPRRDEAATALKSWLALKQGNSDSRNNRQHLITLLKYLGFSLDTGRTSPVVIEEKIAHGLRAKGYMSASDLAKPIPQFGSLAGEQYDVICLWERPDADTIAAKLLEKRLGQHPVVLFYLGRLTDRQRRLMVRRELSAIAVLDETLLVFLSRESDNRLPTFLRCSLPFATLIPYTPFQAGDVPPEMFYGRQDMVRELQKPMGSCLVYGGRQLGKSALLRHVAREFHHPERGQYARVKDIKLVGDPIANQPAQTIWRILRDALREMELLSERITTEGPKEIEKRLRGILEEDKNRKILILFDEADNFFEADFRENFKEVERLRALMFESERRFRVVFAGLNSVLRFQGLPNQPFAHFGSPLCVGALEPYAARQLVKEPMEAL